MRIVVLASGRGSNLAALLAAQAAGQVPVSICAVISDKSDAGALAIARDAGIAVRVLNPAEFSDRARFDHAVFSAAAEFAPELIVCAGFMRVLGAAALAPWLGRIINIHPSLLPKYPGLHTHRRALKAGDRQQGASVHFVSAEVDGGPLIAQVAIDIHTGDTAAQLAERLLPREHALLIASIGLLANGRIRYHKGAVLHEGKLLESPLQLGDDNAWRTAHGD